MNFLVNFNFKMLNDAFIVLVVLELTRLRELFGFLRLLALWKYWFLINAGFSEFGYIYD